MIPCKENKCLTYALCLNKETIECSILMDYIKESRVELPFNDIVQENFPECWSLKSGWEYIDPSTATDIGININIFNKLRKK